MSILKRWRCSKCHNEWDGYCPICDRCTEIGYELPECDQPGYVWEDEDGEL